MNMNFLNVVFAVTMVFSMVSSSEAQLSIAFYDKTCPNAVSIIRKTIQDAIYREPRMAASLIRLHFHDCFVHGCDASLLLTETPSFQSEQNALPNANSVRGYNVIEEAKLAVEYACPKVVSCADILTLAARDASVAVGGPSWDVRLGRRDSTTAYFNQTSDLPSPVSSAEVLIDKFGSKGLNTRDMVALSGAHTLGQARCSTIRDHIYNGTDIDVGFASIRKQTCPQSGGDDNLAPFDFVTPNTFDNYYYRNLIQRKAVIHSDQVLYTSDLTRNIVSDYANHPSNFAVDFAHAMIRMGEIEPLVGQNGIVRRVCSAVN